MASEDLDCEETEAIPWYFSWCGRLNSPRRRRVGWKDMCRLADWYLTPICDVSIFTQVEFRSREFLEKREKYMYVDIVLTKFSSLHNLHVWKEHAAELNPNPNIT
jgi:hypothetical protein